MVAATDGSRAVILCNSYFMLTGVGFFMSYLALVVSYLYVIVGGLITSVGKRELLFLQSLCWLYSQRFSFPFGAQDRLYYFIVELLGPSIYY